MEFRDGLRCDPNGAHVADLVDDPASRCRCGAYSVYELFTPDELARMLALRGSGDNDDAHA